MDGRTVTELHGGEIWQQNQMPFFKCYLVYLGKDGWCRIQPPDEVGNIAWTCESPVAGKWQWQYTTNEMVALLNDNGYELVGQFAELLKERQERNWELAIESVTA